MPKTTTTTAEVAGGNGAAGERNEIVCTTFSSPFVIDIIGEWAEGAEGRIGA